MTAIAVDVKQNAYDESRGRVFYRRLLDAARADSGVESATLARTRRWRFSIRPRGAWSSRATNRGVVLATIVPAWRTARTNPLAVLQHQ